ncbi:MAG: FAD-binding oxidoreductase [Chloroflexota bacterium]|nr:MAG: FAD-binding oxidoreductase [Chloroflexota bacterium]
MTNELFSLNGISPQTIYIPRDAPELAQILALCNAQNCAVVAWGGGTLQHLGNAPKQYDAVIQTANLNQVIDYAFDDLTATFGAGMTLAEIERVLAEHGQFLPLDVPHPERATIGGVLASGMNGALRLRYGPARDYMLGNRFATVDGQIIKAGSKVVKNVAGYELHKVQVGAFGTLGILTEATFKLFPKPPAEISMWASFEELRDACAAVGQVWNLPTPPLAIELFNSDTARLLDSNAPSAWHIAARFGGSKATMAAARDVFANAVNENNARSVEAIEDAQKFWRAIADMPATLHENFSDALLVRVSVPPKELQNALRMLLDTPSTPRIFAHAAVASIYASFQDASASPETFIATLRARVHDLHGHLVVEGAPPTVRKQINAWDDVGASFKLMQSLKRKFDPNNILNPGRFVGGI